MRSSRNARRLAAIILLVPMAAFANSVDPGSLAQQRRSLCNADVGAATACFLVRSATPIVPRSTRMEGAAVACPRHGAREAQAARVDRRVNGHARK